MASISQTKRITVKYKTPNPLFEKWLTEWHDQAQENNSKMQFTFNNALKTLRKYPLPLESGKDCIILKGFGKKLCDMLDKKLKEYKKSGEHKPLQVVHQNETQTSKKSPKKKTTKSPNSSKSYQPTKGTGAYAILLTLLKKSKEPHCSGSLTKNEIIEDAKYLSDTSFIKPEPGSFYTAWSSMSNLVSKGLVLRKGSPLKFSLTEDGKALAVKLLNENENSSPRSEQTGRQDNINSVIDSVFNLDEYSSSTEISSTSKQPVVDFNLENTDNFTSQSSIGSSINKEEGSSSQYSSSNAETIIFAPNTFDIILLVDTQETTGGPRNPLDDETIRQLNKFKIKFEVRHLKAGDFTWICRERQTNQELILPYIVERKRMDDLGHSIKDDRFYEQKFRLKQCGIQNLIYIVESFGNNTHSVLPLPSLMQGATNTLVQDKFQVKFTESHRDSMEYLAGLTLLFENIYKKKTVMSCAKEDLVTTTIADDLISLMSFKHFNKDASKVKHVTNKDIFVKQLIQLEGVSVEKALAIAEKYSSPKLLKMEYDRVGPTQGEKLLINICYGSLKKCIGPVISRTLFQFFTLNKYP